MNIRNFAIIAHIDHGKSTLADRFLELTGLLKKDSHQEQFLDRNPISRERGITIKLAPVRMLYESKVFKVKSQKSDENFIDFKTLWTLNLIDTPGHVDFSYEVDRTLSCVEGAILLVDATQGIQAQTIANAYKAMEKNLVIIPVINKIDLPNAEIEQTKKELQDFFGFKDKEIFEISAKTGKGVSELLEEVIQKIPLPKESARHRVFSSTSPPEEGGSPKSLTQKQVSSLIFDSYYDSHRGVIAFVRVFEGEIKKGDSMILAQGKQSFEVVEVGVFTPDLQPQDSLFSGEVGYVVTNLKDIHEVRVGDTITGRKNSASPLEGYKKIRSMVFASIFPTDPHDYLLLKKAIEKLYLNDSALVFSPIYSQALGAGLRVGFLGLLHADVVRERLEREFNLSVVLTPPQVEFRYEKNSFYEPYVKVFMVTPQEYLGAVMRLCENYRARFITMDNKNQISLTYEMPMSEMISDFFDALKSVSSGYASLDWEFLRYEKIEADKLTIFLNGDPVEEFSEIVVKERSLERAQALVKKLKEIIPRQQFEIRIQAHYKGRIIASERVAPFRKNVTAKLYGGDRTRKDKLLEKQKEGKKRMKMVGKVEIPKEAFLQLFRKN